MKLLSVKLRGFTGIKKGLGLDEIFVDLTNTKGLIALAGPNGHGKTTLLDNLHPYRQLASRSGALQHHVFLRDSFRELTFIYKENHYRILIKIDSQSGKQEGFVYLNHSEKSETDGKTVTYDAYIENLFGSSTLFFNSVFSAQGAKKISDLTTGKLKELFSEFLRLARLVGFEDAAKKTANRLDEHANSLQAAKSAYESEADKTSGVTENLDMAITVRKRLEMEIPRLRAGLADLETEAGKLQKKVDEIKLGQKHKHDLEVTVAQSEKGTAEKVQSIDEMIKSSQEKEASLTLSIQGRKKLLEKRDQVEAACRAVPVTEQEVADLEGVNSADQIIVEQYNKDIATKKTVENRLLLERKDVENAKELARLEREGKNLKQQASDLDRRDTTCVSTTCSFIVRALKAKEQLPVVEAALARSKKQTSEKVAEINLLLETTQGGIYNLEGRKTNIKTVILERKEKIESLRKNLETLKPITAKKHELETASAIMDEHTAQVKTHQADIEKLMAQKDDVLRAGKEATAEIMTAIANADKLLSGANGSESALEDIKNRIHSNQDEINGKVQNLTKAQTQITYLEEQVKAHQDTLEKIEAHERDITLSRQEVAEWRYIQNACSRDGLRALEIDSVAPGISAHANEILSKTFGPTNTVRFQTQDPETGREVLDILVLRADGTETELDNLSGGEKVWCLKALRLAMTLIAKERSGGAFESTFADEEDGALDAENAQNFIRMYKAYMSAGEFKDCFFISHRPECVAMADHVIEFNGNGISIN